MRAALIAVALLLTGCAGEDAEPAPATAAAPTTTTTPPAAPAIDPATERAYLADIRTGTLLGDYRDAELVALGLAICDNYAAGLDPLAHGVPGDGTYRFPEVAVPVWALDAVNVDFAARGHLCRQ